MSKFTGGLTAIFLLVFIGIFSLVTIIKPKEHFSETENRKLAEPPELSSDVLMNGDFTDGLNQYMTDHFAGRSAWLEFRTKAKSQIGETIVNDVYTDSRMLLNTKKSSEKALPDYADAINSFAENYSGTVYITVIPTSAGVYSDLLPVYLQSSPENQRINSFYDMLDADIRRIDAFNILKMMKESYIYYRNDTKWTSYGAYCVYRTVIQKLGFLPTSYDKYTIEHVADSFRGNLYSKTLYSAAKPDILDIYDYPSGESVTSCTVYDNYGRVSEGSLYDRSKLESGYMYDMYLGSDAPVVEIETTVNNDRKLLVVKDSYADCFIPFLTQHYSSITVLSLEEMNEEIDRYVDTSEYEQTLFLFGKECMDSGKYSSNICERNN